MHDVLVGVRSGARGEFSQNPMSTLASRFLFRCVSAAVCSGLWSGFTLAHATPGEHLQIGKSAELAPEVDLGFQYRSNIAQANVGQDPRERRSGVALTVAPGARLEHDAPGSYLLLQGNYKIIKYLARSLSVADQFNDFDIRLNGELLRDKPVSLYFSDRPALVNNNADRWFGGNPFHTRFRNEAHGGLIIQPGSVLSVRVGGSHEYDNIQIPPGVGGTGDVRAFNSRQGAGVNWDVRYKFLPRTAIVVMGTYKSYDWARNWIVSPNNPGVAIPDFRQFRISGGLRGRITERMTINAELGYGASPYDENSVIDVCSGGVDCDPTNSANPFGRDLSGLQKLLVTLQAKYSVVNGPSASLTYTRDFNDVFFSNFMTYDTLRLSYASPKIGSRIGLSATLTGRRETYVGETNRSDLFVDGTGVATYAFRDWVAANAAVSYRQRLSNVASAQYVDFVPQIYVTFAY